jgi:hypothetical protein
MNKIYLGNATSWVVCVAPLFYYSAVLSVLRLCVFGKAMIFLLIKLFTCCNKITKRGNIIS